MIRNIIFDWSGVISDDLQAVYNAAMAVFTKHGVRAISYQEFFREWQQPYMVFYNRYIPNLDRVVEEASFKEAYKITFKEYPPKIFPGVKEMLQKFKK